MLLNKRARIFGANSLLSIYFIHILFPFSLLPVYFLPVQFQGFPAKNTKTILADTFKKSYGTSVSCNVDYNIYSGAIIAYFSYRCDADALPIKKWPDHFLTYMQ